MPKRSVVLSVVAVSCLAIAALASAAGSDFSSLSKRSASKPLNSPGQNAKVTIGCNGGKEAVSGGFDAGKQTFTHGPIITSSRPKGDDWTASANEYANSGPQNDQLTGEVNCASKAPGISIVSARANLAPGDERAVEAKCTGNKNAIAGGFKTRYNGAGAVSGVIMTASYRSAADTWKVKGFSIDTSSERSGLRTAGAQRGTTTRLTAYAACASVPALKAASKTVKGSGENVHPTAKAKCKQGRKAVSGGFRSATIPTGFIQAIVPEASGLKGKRAWKARGYFFPLGSGSLKWTAYAYCA